MGGQCRAGLDVSGGHHLTGFIFLNFASERDNSVTNAGSKRAIPGDVRGGSAPVTPSPSLRFCLFLR